MTGTSLAGDHHLDLLGAARWTADRVELEARLGARPWTDSSGGIGEAVTGVFAELSAVVAVSSRVAGVIGVGNYPADPVRRVLAARYLTAGLRLALAPRSGVARPDLAGATLATLRGRSDSSDTDAPRLEIAQAGPASAIRVHAPGARSVQLMADFTDWEAVTLTRIDAATWEIQRPLTAGVHRLNIRIDGGAWLVPAGTRPEAGEFGGAVGVIIVR
jgi:hypothetical protein